MPKWNSQWMTSVAEFWRKCVPLILSSTEFCLRYRFFFLGALGWALVFANYPFDWTLPKYAEY
jgi:hypothetical protein